MKESFICSFICPNGIVGGMLHIEDKAITYNTNKLTVDRQYRNLSLPLNEIGEISWKQIILPIATIQMKNGRKYQFIIFNKNRFNKYYTEVKEI